MNDYQLRKEKDFLLPQTVYRQALYAVKDLDRLRRKLLFLNEESGCIRTPDPSEVHVTGGSISDLTGDLASELINTKTRIDAIEKAFIRVPEKYREGIRDKLVYDVPYDGCHCINTWKKWQQVLLYYVAVNLEIL